MENINFISDIACRIPFAGDKKIAGNCLFFKLTNGNRAKTYCESTCAVIEIINVCNGRIDMVEFPFSRYFEPVQCGPNAPCWHQHIRDGQWNFSIAYPHVLPKETDYQRIASAMADYMYLFGEAEGGVF